MAIRQRGDQSRKTGAVEVHEAFAVVIFKFSLTFFFFF